MFTPWQTRIKIDQPADSNASRDEIQTLNIKVEDAGDGAYIVIQTKRWAFNREELDDFVAYLKTLCENYDKNMDKALSSFDYPAVKPLLVEKD